LQEREKIREQFQSLEEKNLALQQARREIIQTEKLASVGRLAAGIAHEIGNPLGIILGYLHMLRGGDVAEKERSDYLSRIEAEAERVNTTIRDLLDYAQPSSREAQEVNVNDLIQDTCALVANQKEGMQSRVIFNLADGLPPVHAHEKLLRQIIINLVLNARDAMAAAGGTLTLTTALEATDKENKISLTIADTGAGIPLEHQDKIFDPFFTTKDQGKGTGLGLANVHRIVELSGGTITFSSIPEEGTTFRITFPAGRPINVKRET
ncbi:MAG: ATP-binding protein, partial [Pseudomonadota bacterium]